MPVVSHGIDLVETERVKRLVEAHGQRFLDRCFTPAEQAYCAANAKRRFEHLAGRFAAKEAVLKALGTGWRRGIAWTDVEIAHSAGGQPTVRLTGEAARVAAKLRIVHWLISITHVRSHAFASAIALTGHP